MKRFDIDESIVIHRPPEAVWRRTVEEFVRGQPWRARGEAGRENGPELAERPFEVGTRFWWPMNRYPGRGRASVNEVTEMDRYRRISWRTKSAEGAFSSYGTCLFEPFRAGTRFHIKLAFPPRTLLGRLAHPIIRLMGGPLVARGINAIKRELEEGKGRS